MLLTAEPIDGIIILRDLHYLGTFCSLLGAFFFFFNHEESMLFSSKSFLSQFIKVSIFLLCC